MDYKTFTESKKTFNEKMVNEGIFSNILNYAKKLKGSRDIIKQSELFENDMQGLMDKKLQARKEVLLKKVAFQKEETEELKTELEDATKASQEKVESIQNEAKTRTELFNDQVNKIINKNSKNKDKLTVLANIEKNKALVNVYKYEQDALEKYGDDEGVKQRNLDIKNKMKEIKNLSTKLTEEGNETESSFDYKADDEIFYLNDAKDKVIGVTVLSDSLDDNEKLKVKSENGTEISADLEQLDKDEETLKQKIE